MAALYPDYPPQLTPEQTEFMTDAIKEWSVAHGLAVRPPQAFTEQDPSGSLTTAAPVTLFPSLFPLNCFHEALMIQTAYNEMYANIARDEAWLGEVCTELAKIDDFIAKLWNVHEAVKKEGYAQHYSLGIFRSDYMVHLPAETSRPTIRQVEFNTIASSFGGLASRVTSLHRFLLQTAAYPREAAMVIRPDFLPTNSSIEKIAAGLAQAHAAYGPSKTRRLTCVLFVVQDGERNVFDQKHIEYALFAAARAKVFRCPFSQLLARTQVEEDAGRVLLYAPPAFPDRQYEVTTVYFRAAYSPDEYKTDDDWKARLHVERSAAIKCPSILTHLAGSKKVQQILATPDSPHVLRFLPFEGIAGRLRGTFAPMYSLDESPAGQEGRKLALDPATAARFVLKPQREGGGNNVYREKIPAFLKSIDEATWPAYVLMEMIETPAQRNVIYRNGEVQEGGVICELGVFGTVLWTSQDGVVDEELGKGKLGPVIENEEAGYLLRTKGDASEEGGVAAGFGCVDSCVLVDV